MVTDETFLQFTGGISNSCLNNILSIGNAIDENNELPIIRRSSYYDFDKFSSLAKKQGKQFSILSSNIQSINAKFSELEAYVNDVSSLNFKFSIICLQESWLSENDDLSLIQLAGYDCISQGKSCSSKGGLLIYIDKRFDYEVKMNLNTYEHWEGQIIQITGGGLSQPVIIGNIYRPPRPSKENYNKFINEFSTVISTLPCHQNNSVILAGDYNINMLQINEQEHCSTFFDMLTSFSLFPQITLPTRFTTRTGTLIDNFFCNLTKRILQSTAGILIKKFSDHQPYFMFVNTTLKEDHTTKLIQVNVQNKEAMLKVKNELHSSDIYKKLDTNPNTDPNYNYNIIIDEINQAKNKYMTSKLVKFNKYKHKKSTWITQGLLTSIRYRDKLYKQIKLTNPESSKYAILLVNLKTYNSILKTSVRKAKQLYYDKCFNNFKFEKNKWKTINEILSKNKTNKSFPKYFKDSDSIVRDKSEIVNKFNDFLLI